MNEQPDEPTPPGDLHDRLGSSSPEERAEILLGLIEQAAEAGVALPSTDGRQAVLLEIDLGRPKLEARLDPAATSPPIWWSAEQGGLNLRNADLRGARLGRADLRGADLRGAKLAGASLGRADLRGAALDGADLTGADLAGADLRDAHCGEAILDDSLLEDADLQGAFLRFARFRGAILEHVDFRGADLWSVDMEGATLTGCILQGVKFQEANLHEADLTGADLRGVSFINVNLNSAILRGANLEDATLLRVDLRGAELREARLTAVDLTGCDLGQVRLSDAWLERTRMNRDQLGGSIGEEQAGEYDLAVLGYLALEKNFAGLGDPDSSVWAYLRRRRMQKLGSLHRAREERRAGRPLQAVHWYAKSVSDQTTEWLCNYGESVPRILGSIGVLFLVFTLTYGLTGSVVREVEVNGVTNKVPTHSLTDLAIFSLLSMTAGAPGAILLPRGDLAMFLAGVQMFFGIALTGLLGFVLGNRIRR